MPRDTLIGGIGSSIRDAVDFHENFYLHEMTVRDLTDQSCGAMHRAYDTV
ncbi:MAG: hypothetical protein ACLPN1_14445 [Dissulfurispiraceae bacterium]|jgi:hypothetical protein